MVDLDINRKQENDMTITAFDKANLKTLSIEMEALLQKYAQEIGIEITIGNISFTAESADIKVYAKVKGGQSLKDKTVQRELHINARVDQLSLDVVKNRQLTGYSSRSPKYPYRYKDLYDGKQYKCTRELAKLYFTTPESMARRVIAA